MKKQVVIMGLGRFGVALANTLLSMGYDILAMDIDEKKVQAIAPTITRAVQADGTDEAVLKELGVDKFDVAVVAMGSDVENSVLSTILLKKLRVRYVVARAENELHGSILDKIGADKVVYPEREMGARVAHGLTLTQVLDYMPLAAAYGVAKVSPPNSFIGRTLSELGLGREGKWEIGVLLIQREREIIVTPDRMEVVRDNDILVVSGNDSKIEQMLTEARKTKREEEAEDD
jgi:trk system potassium uptake protein TrkA